MHQINEELGIPPEQQRFIVENTEHKLMIKYYTYTTHITNMHSKTQQQRIYNTP
jgi:hypothetical protein